MSTEIKTIEDKVFNRGVSVTAFAGGMRRGRSIQLTQQRASSNMFFDNIQLDTDMARELRDTLNAFLEGEV